MNRSHAGAGLLTIAITLWGCSGSRAGAPSEDGAAGAGSAGTSGNGTGGVGGCKSNSDCAVGVCNAGSCKAVSCVPNTQFCADGSVQSCNSDGTAGPVTQHCISGQFCLENSGKASCSPTACFPGDRICAGQLATQCEPDGSGPKPGGDDCTAAKQVCFAGQCLDPLCTPGQKLCDGGSLYLCGNEGTARIQITTCGSSEVCDSTQGACVTKLCDPGKLSCDGTRVVSCNASGGSFTQTGTDCANTDSVCVGGSCKPIVCTANQQYCKDGNPFSCSSDGTSAVQTDTCTAPARCVQNYASLCVLPSCQPNQTMCQGSVVISCAADGSGWSSGGLDCSLTGQTCANGQCVADACTPNSSFCQDNGVQGCDEYGASFSLTQFCGAQQRCVSLAQTALCVPRACPPGGTGCVGEKLGTCSTDGSGVTSATDCGALGQICTLQGCAAKAVETTSQATDVSNTETGELIADVLFVDTPRKLTEIAANITAPQGRKLAWSVYVQTNPNDGTSFDLDYETTVPALGTGTESSGALALELQAGKLYMVGVSGVDGSFAYYLDQPSAPPTLSFGHVIGSVQNDASNQVNFQGGLGQVYALRLTTVAP